MQSEHSLLPRDAILQLRASKIREVANAGMDRKDVLAFWFGEPDEVTPDFIRSAASESLLRGETFYSHNLGLPELRSTVASYLSALHANPAAAITSEHVAITSAGVNALSLAAQCIVNPGDRVVCVTPLWPNLVEIPKILSANVECVSLQFGESGWQLDMDRLLAALTPDTRLLMVNSPNNPTGWTLERAEQQALLQHCRRTGTWIIADEVYERLYYREGARCAPSFLDIATPEDRLVVVHSFSKSFLMTGWRLGWMVAPAALIEAMGKLIEFNTSCAPVFVQRGALAALARADEFVPGLVARMKACRDTLLPALAALPGVSVAVPDGGMYAFFRVQGQDDSLACAKRLVAEVGLGLAPGAAFGAEAEGWLRWCFASRDPARLTDGVGRLARALRL